jgi:hypothetical protein
MDSDAMNMIGSALISNTSICEVSRLLIEREPTRAASSDMWAESRRDEMRVDQMRVFDLFSLVEAVVLHERLFTLPCKPSKDLAHLSLRNQLISAGVVRELDTRKEHAQIANLIYRSLVFPESEPVSSSKNGLSNEANLRVDIMKASFVRDFLGVNDTKSTDRGANKKSTARSQAVLALYDTRDDSARELSSYTSFPELTRSLIGTVESMGSGDYEDDHKDLASFLREMYYIVVSEQYALPYWPQLTRLSFSKRFPNYFDASFRTKLFRRVAQALKSTVTEAFDDLGEQVAFIPPFSSLVLERSSRPEDIAASLLEVRDKYRKLRQNLIELEQARRNARSIKDRKRIRAKERFILEEALRVLIVRKRYGLRALFGTFQNL